jgi:hypothetical protein
VLTAHLKRKGRKKRKNSVKGEREIGKEKRGEV